MREVHPVEFLSEPGQYMVRTTSHGGNGGNGEIG